jgi:DNA-binding winged helix-turn-helix (wHTH) protein
MGSSANSPANGVQRYRFGIYEADVRAGELTRDGVKVKLQEQPFQVLLMLIERAGDVVSREELQQRLWPADTFVDFDHSLNTAINKLREALRDSADNPRFIETKPRRGYRFIAPVQALGEAAVVTGVAAEGGATSSAEQTAPNDIADKSIRATQESHTTQESRAAQAISEEELPKAHRGTMRTLLGLIQLMYLIFYIVALARLGEVGEISERFLGGKGWILVTAVIVTAVLGIPVRLYLGMAVIFDYAKTGVKYLRIFAAVLVLGLIWALAPFLLTDYIGVALAFAATAMLLYLPFSERTLVRMTYTNL